MPKLHAPDALIALCSELSGKRAQCTRTITMCAGTACRACGCMPVAEALRAELEKQELNDKVFFRTTGCHGFCEQSPLAIIEPGNKPDPNKFIDLQMLVLNHGGRERTKPEFEQLFSSAGFRLTNIIDTPAMFSIIEGQKA